MTRSRKRALCWLYAILMTAALLAFVLLCTDVCYSCNDDPGILRAYMGYEDGVPARFQLFVHGALSWPLAWLSGAFPGLPWFSYLQLALLALASTVLAKGVMQRFVRHGQPLWLGALTALVLEGAVCLRYASRITFTQTAALLGAAAAVQLLSADHEGGAGRAARGMLGASGLLALCYALREMAVLPALAFCGLAFFIVLGESYLPQKRSPAPLLACAAAALVTLGALAGLRAYEVERSGAREYVTLQNENTRLMDYYGADTVPEEARELVGWSPATLALVKEWCFLDESVTTEAFRTLTAYMEAQDTRTPWDRARQGITMLGNTLSASRAELRALGAALLAAALGLLCAALRRRPWYVAALLLTLLGAAAMLLYLSFQGRVPLRALLTALLPASALCFCLLPACLPKARPLGAACCLLCAAYTVWSLSALVPLLLRDEESELELGSAMGDAEEYALGDPESLFIYDGTLVGADLRVFPTYPEDIPHNLTYWGGWNLRSPQNRALFERFGIDIDHFDPATFLRDDVFLVSGRLDPPPLLILDWLHEKVDPDIDWEIWSEYGMVYIFHFYVP